MNASTSLGELIGPEGVFDVPEGVRDKWALVRWLGEKTCARAGIRAPEPVVEALLDRERMLSTGIGLGIAVPHARHPSVPRETLCVARLRPAMPFDALDGRPVSAAFCILMPSGRQRRYIEILAAV